MKIDTKNFVKFIPIVLVLIVLLALIWIGLGLFNSTPVLIESTDRTLPGAVEADSNIVKINNQEVGKTNYQAAGLAAMWHFNGDLFDSSASGLDGKASGISYVDGIWGKKAISFNGNSFVKIEDSPLLNFAPKQGFAIALWVKSSSNSPAIILSKGNVNSNEVGYGVQNNSTIGASLKISDGANPVYEGGSVVSPAKFHFLVFSVDHVGNCQRFVDGEIVGRDNCPLTDGVDLTNTSPLYIGANFDGTSTTDYFTGAIQDLSIWRRPLSATEVKDMYTGSISK